MAHRNRLIQCPEFEKVEIATYLVNTLSLTQLLAIEVLARSGKLKKILSEQSVNAERTNQINIKHYKSTTSNKYQ